MWLETLKELKKTSGKSTHAIAEGTCLPERTIIRIFSGETMNPSISTLIPIINFLGGSFDEIFAESKAVVGTESLAELKENVDVVSAQNDVITSENEVLNAQNLALKNEVELLKVKLMHAEEKLAIHNFYIKLSSINKNIE